jgi:cytochrome c oxidase cbb3-type subunit 3
MKTTLTPRWVSWLRAITTIVTFVVAGFCGQAAFAQIRQSDRTDANSSTHPSSAAGEKTFASTCSGCHGLDGQGSERAPNIVKNPKVQNLSDAKVSAIISNGIPGTGMPPFHTLTDEKIREIVSYLRMLQGKGGIQSLPGNGTPGNATRGKEIFFGKGECSSCHAMKGAGGFLGPDLSTYGATTSAQAVLGAIVNQNRIVPAGYKQAVVTTRSGDRFEGAIRNEDNFSLQLQTKDGSFHFFQKSDLQNVERSDRSPMPANYRESLSSVELDDLVNYLMNAAAARHEQTSDDEEEIEVPH